MTNKLCGLRVQLICRVSSNRTIEYVTNRAYLLQVSLMYSQLPGQGNTLAIAFVLNHNVSRGTKLFVRGKGYFRVFIVSCRI